jgi:hypothetical protein
VQENGLLQSVGRRARKRPGEYQEQVVRISCNDVLPIDRILIERQHRGLPSFPRLRHIIEICDDLRALKVKPPGLQQSIKR